MVVYDTLKTLEKLLRIYMSLKFQTEEVLLILKQAKSLLASTS
jgi:hypothetical protein